MVTVRKTTKRYIKVTSTEYGGTTKPLSMKKDLRKLIERSIKMVEKSLRPKLRPKKQGDAPKTSLRPRLRERRFEINSMMYDDKEQSVIDFIDKNGNTERTLPLFEVEKIWKKNKSGLEPTAGRYSAKKVMKYLKENNPSSKEFIKWASSTALNKGGLLAKKKPKAYNKGGMIDYRKTGMFK